MDDERLARLERIAGAAETALTRLKVGFYMAPHDAAASLACIRSALDDLQSVEADMDALAPEDEEAEHG